MSQPLRASPNLWSIVCCAGCAPIHRHLRKSCRLFMAIIAPAISFTTAMANCVRCSIGNEDIAWAICPTWGWPDANRPGFLITRDEAFGIWEQTSGLRIDPQALHWWSLFSTVKGIGLWTACAHNVMQNGSLNAIEFAACWFPRDCHLRLMAELLFAKVP